VKNRVKTLIDHAFHKQYMTVRAVNLAKLSMLVNAVLALGKIGMGVYSLSLFLCINGFYNIGIAAAKRITVKSHGEQDRRKHYKAVGRIILVTSLVYIVYCANMAIRGKANVSYDTITSIAIAVFTFTEIGTAVRGLLTTRKTDDLTLAAAKRVNFVTALISLVLTQSALLGLDHIANAARYCGWTGVVLGGVSAIVGLLMLSDPPLNVCRGGVSP